MTTIGAVFINDRDLEADFLLYASALPGWPGNLSAAERDAPLSTGPQMQGGTLDPRLIVRKPATATIVGIMVQPTADAARIALDNLRALLWSGAEVKVRTFYAPDRYCVATCVGLVGVAHIPEVLDGSVDVTMSFQIKNGVAFRDQPDGYALSTTPTPCPIGSAESRPVIMLHGNGAAMANPSIAVRNAAGDVVQRMDFTGTLTASEALRIDTARASVSKITDGVITDALAAGWWPPGNGDFPLLRPYDGAVEAGQFPSVTVDGLGSILYYTVTVGNQPPWQVSGSLTRVAGAYVCSDGLKLDLLGDATAVGSATSFGPLPLMTAGRKRVRFRIAKSTSPGTMQTVQIVDASGVGTTVFFCTIDFTQGAAPVVVCPNAAWGTMESVTARTDGAWDVVAYTAGLIASNPHTIVVYPQYPSPTPMVASLYIGGIGLSDQLTPVGSIAYTRRFS